MDSNSSLTDPPDPSGAPETPAAETLRCSCGAVVPGDLGNCPACGRFQRGNSAAVTHGLRRLRLTPKELDRYTAVLSELRSQYGGGNVLQRYQQQEYAMLTVHIERIDGYLAEHGTLTKAGRQPAAMTARLALGARRDQVATRIRDSMPDTRATASARWVRWLTDAELAQIHALTELARDRMALGLPLPTPALPVAPAVEDGVAEREPGDVNDAEVAPEVPPPASTTPTPETTPEPEPTPQILVRHVTEAGLIPERVRRLTEADVREAVRMLGDEALADYDAGRLSKAAAYDIARRRHEELLQLRTNSTITRREAP